jgi:hypothetical protein
LLPVAFLTACAGLPRTARTPSNETLRVAVLPVANIADIRNLKDITSQPADAAGDTDEQTMIHRRMREVTADMTPALTSRLTRHPCFTVVPDSDVAAVMHDYAAGLPSGVPDDDMRWLGGMMHAQAVLQIDLSGYGQIKRKWLVYLIGSGVVEGLVQGVVVGKATSGWAGAVVALEEIAQETITWGGGAKLFKTYYSPVTLEGRLVNVADGEVLWQGTAFVATDRKALKHLSREEGARKETQLALTAEKAENELLDGLLKAAGDHLHRECR